MNLEKRVEYRLKEILHRMTVNILEHTKRGNKGYAYVLVNEDLENIDKLLELDRLSESERLKIKTKLISIVEGQAFKYLNGKTDTVLPTGLFNSKNKKRGYNRLC